MAGQYQVQVVYGINTANGFVPYNPKNYPNGVPPTSTSAVVNVGANGTIAPAAWNIASANASGVDKTTVIQAQLQMVVGVGNPPKAVGNPTTIAAIPPT
jgi:hypothetical protein